MEAVLLSLSLSIIMPVDGKKSANFKWLSIPQISTNFDKIFFPDNQENAPDMMGTPPGACGARGPAGERQRPQKRPFFIISHSNQHKNLLVFQFQ